MKAEIYTWSTCPFCRAAVQLLKERGVTYDEHVMDGLDEELNEIKTRYSHSTVPIVLIDGEFIGGFDALQAADQAGTLKVG